MNRPPLRLCPLVLALSAAALLTGCNTNEPRLPRTEGPNTHLYNYTAWDKDGRVIARGVMSLEYDDPRSFHGVWKFEKVGNPPRIGPQDGVGRLTGRKEGGQLRIDLDPEKPNYDVNLVGSALGRNIDGSWQYMGVGGILNQGKFLAERRTTPVE